MIEKEIVNQKIIEIIKKHNIIAYKLYKKYLINGKIDPKKEQKIRKLALNIYLNSLTKDEQTTVKRIDNTINTTKQDIQNNLSAIFYETYAIDFYDSLLTEKENIIILRDKQGFFGINELIQSQIDNCSLELNILNNQIYNKEELMNGKRAIKKNTLCRKETLILSYFLGYGDARDEILNTQDRNKILIKNKEKK